MTMPTAHIFLRLPILFIIFNLITTLMPSALCDDAAQYTECRNTYDCGLLKNISYPFWAANSRPQHCGREGYQLTCLDDQNPVIRIEDQDFLVLDISREVYIITITRVDLWDSPCPSRLVNTTFNLGHTLDLIGDQVVEQYPNHHAEAMSRSAFDQNGHLGLAAADHHPKSVNVGYLLPSNSASSNFECSTGSDNWNINSPYIFNPLVESSIIKCSISDSSSDGDLL